MRSIIREGIYLEEKGAHCVTFVAKLPDARAGTLLNSITDDVRRQLILAEWAKAQRDQQVLDEIHPAWVSWPLDNEGGKGRLEMEIWFEPLLTDGNESLFN